VLLQPMQALSRSVIAAQGRHAGAFEIVPGLQAKVYL